jgi:methylmalonyl-CoA/ethylmalonyl-CoA epimerase
MVIDHIGYVVKNINQAIERFVNIYGFIVIRDVIYDSIQRVQLAMLCSSNNYRIELIEPVDENSQSYDFMCKGGGFHHLCYSVIDIETAILELQKKGHLLFMRPTEAILFNGSRIAFLFSKEDKRVIELVEKKGDLDE